MSRLDPARYDARILAALREMADAGGMVTAPIAEIAKRADVPVHRTSERLGYLRAKRLIERVRDGRGWVRGGTLYRVSL